jgi:thiol-disulfide isomerase/thioredoxin
MLSIDNRARTRCYRIACVLVACGFSVRAEDAAILPRYRLLPGMELTFKGTSDFKYQNGAFHYRTDTTAWVVRKNDDGSYRIVVRESHTMDREGDFKQKGEPDISLVSFDLFDDGKLGSKTNLGYSFDPSSIFPRLPDTSEQLRPGWSGEGRYDSKIKYRDASQTGAAELTFSAARESGEDAIYLTSHRSVIHFDLKRGVVRKIETENAQGYGFVGKGKGETELKAVETRAPNFLKEFASVAVRYFEASSAYEKLTEQASKDANATKGLLAKAEATLKERRDAITMPLFREAIDHQLKSHSQMASYYEKQAKDRAEVLNKPAADWQTKDLQGKAHGLKDYRGKVVLLDFWYRGCGWCMRAMPQVMELADDFKDQPVAVLGMNTDRDEKDAQFVVDAMKLNYPVLKAEGLPEKYKVQGFPTLIIIDPEGNVADVHVGYSPTLRQDVGTVVKRLLKKP